MAHIFSTSFVTLLCGLDQVGFIAVLHGIDRVRGVISSYLETELLIADSFLKAFWVSQFAKTKYLVCKLMHLILVTDP